METTQKSVYPVHKMVISLHCEDQSEYENDASLDHRIKAHYFDKVMPNKYSLKKQFKQLFKPNELQHGIMSIRTDRFKINEGKMPPFVRLGIDGEKRKALIEKLHISE